MRHDVIGFVTSRWGDLAGEEMEEQGPVVMKYSSGEKNKTPRPLDQVPDLQEQSCLVILT